MQHAPLISRETFLAAFDHRLLDSLDGVGRITWAGAELAGDLSAVGKVGKRYAHGLGGIVGPRGSAVAALHTQCVFKGEAIVWAMQPPEGLSAHLVGRVFNPDVTLPIATEERELTCDTLGPAELLGLRVLNSESRQVEFRALLIGHAVAG